MIFKKRTYIFTELNSVEFGGIIISNKLKKFHVREANPIKDFAYPVSKVPNTASIEKPWYPISGKNKSAENNNKDNVNNKVGKNTNKLFKNKININKSQNNIKREKFIGIFILIKV